jgi:hypothetical protein
VAAAAVGGAAELGAADVPGAFGEGEGAEALGTGEAGDTGGAGFVGVSRADSSANSMAP